MFAERYIAQLLTISALYIVLPLERHESRFEIGKTDKLVTERFNVIAKFELFLLLGDGNYLRLIFETNHLMFIQALLGGKGRQTVDAVFSVGLPFRAQLRLIRIQK